MIQFVSVSSGGLSGELKKSDSETRMQLEKMINEIIKTDPEFILKVIFCKTRPSSKRYYSILHTMVMDRNWLNG